MGSARRMLFGALGWIAGSLVVRHGHALPLADGELTVERSAAAPDCPDDIALRSATLALGKQAEEPPAGQPGDTLPVEALSADVAFDRDATGYLARIRASGRKQGFREIRAPGESCAPLAEATSVALAILFDFLPAEPAPTPPPLVLPAAETQIKPAPLAQKEPPPSPPPSREPARNGFASLSAEGGVAYGLLGSAFTGQVGGAFHFALGERVEIGAGGLWTPGRSIAFEPGEVLVSLAAGRAGALAWLARSKQLDVGWRAELLLGALHGEGRGFDHPDGVSELWAAASLGAVGRYAFNRRWGLRFALAAVIPFRGQNFTVTVADEPPADVFESIPVAALLELGPELVFF